MASEESGPGPHALTMHQPWASLLVHGIKRIEGRPWPTNFRGRLWIHAASKQPSEQTIKAWLFVQANCISMTKSDCTR